jgi:hypothetical protein
LNLANSMRSLVKVSAMKCTSLSQSPSPAQKCLPHQENPKKTSLPLLTYGLKHILDLIYYEFEWAHRYCTISTDRSVTRHEHP